MRDRVPVVGGAGLAMAWLLAALVLDLATRGSSIVLVPLFAISPLIACAVLPAAPTAVFAGGAVALALASGTWNASWDEAQQVVRVVDVVLVSGAAVIVAAVRVRRERQHERVAVIAEVAQRAILPKLPTRVDRVAVAARYVSAAQDAVVGGDLYDCYHSETYTRFLVGDVRGKGIAAVEQAARVIRVFRQAAALRPTLPEVAEEMSTYLTTFFDDEEFVTALLVDVSDPDRLVLVSCGHPAPLFVSGDGRGRLVEPPVCMPLGLGVTYEAMSLPWAPDDRLLMYTDGLSEARDETGTFLPVTDLARVLSTGTGEEALEAVLDQVRRHVPAGDLNDDLAVVLVEHLADTVRPAEWPPRGERVPLELAR